VSRTAILLIDCPDAKGIVAAVAEFLYRHGANILHPISTRTPSAACS
jgi:formyltetrahydrofolate deformylase